MESNAAARFPPVASKNYSRFPTQTIPNRDSSVSVPGGKRGCRHWAEGNAGRVPDNVKHTYRRPECTQANLSMEGKGKARSLLQALIQEGSDVWGVQAVGLANKVIQ